MPPPNLKSYPLIAYLLFLDLVFTIPTVPDFLNFANAALPAQQSAGIGL